MARNKTLFIYNDTDTDQEWSIYSEGVINQTVTLGQVRKSFRLSLAGDVVFQFGVNDAVYFKATYDYDSDTWTHRSDTPNEFSFAVMQSGMSLTSSYKD